MRGPIGLERGSRYAARSEMPGRALREAPLALDDGARERLSTVLARFQRLEGVSECVQRSPHEDGVQDQRNHPHEPSSWPTNAKRLKADRADSSIRQKEQHVVRWRRHWEVSDQGDR